MTLTFQLCRQIARLRKSIGYRLVNEGTAASDKVHVGRVDVNLMPVELTYTVHPEKYAHELCYDLRYVQSLVSLGFV
jgi:hypothetical protein